MDISSSQESSLPLSQETFSYLWCELPAAVQNVFLKEDMNMNGEGVLFDVPNHSEEDILENNNLSIVENSHNSSIPAIDGYPGYFDFKASIPSSRNFSKSATYLYSNQLNKAFIKINTYCPFNFHINKPKLEGYLIRATLHFNSRESANDIVERCINHSHKDAEAGDYFSQHLLKCESPNAQYFVDPDSQRYSVAVPFENAPIGQSYSSYLFKFTCYTSCSGGPNRRPFCVVFTLEKQGMVVGRCKIDVKICAGPHRDMRSEEDSFQPQPNSQTESHIRPAPTLATQPVKRKRSPSEKDYIIRVKDEECYRLLSAVKKYFYFKKLVAERTNWVPSAGDMRSILQMLTSNSSSEEDKEVEG